MIVAGVALIAVSARWTFALPGTDVPQSAQTLAVLVTGGLAALSNGARAAPAIAAATLAVYLGIGALGAPVFADGASGTATLAGPTGGFLLGFVPAAAAAAWLWRSTAVPSGRPLPRALPRKLPPALPQALPPALPQALPQALSRLFGLMACHILILACGWVRLALLIGMAPAWQAGVAPFVTGAVVKSAAAAALLSLAELVIANRVASAQEPSR